MSDWIRESNLIEEVDDPAEDARSLQAWNWIRKQSYDAGRRHTVLLTLHRKIMRNLRPEIAGRYRRCRVWVGGREGVPWEEIIPRLDGWFKFYGKSLSDIKIQKAHIEFERIHPFVDGNGRSGRMLMNWQRIQAGLEPLCIKAAERWAYYTWFADAPTGARRDDAR